jgi:hypothetical protein
MITFGKYRPLLTEEEAFQEGKTCGATWTDNWQPGGPWVCRNDERTSRDTEWNAWCAHTAKINAAWLRGFASTVQKGA